MCSRWCAYRSPRIDRGEPPHLDRSEPRAHRLELDERTRVQVKARKVFADFEDATDQGAKQSLGGRPELDGAREIVSTS